MDMLYLLLDTSYMGVTQRGLYQLYYITCDVPECACGGDRIGRFVLRNGAGPAQFDLFDLGADDVLRYRAMHTDIDGELHLVKAVSTAYHLDALDLSTTYRSMV